MEVWGNLHWLLEGTLYDKQFQGKTRRQW